MERASEDGEAVRERDRASRHQARQAEDESRRIREAASDMFETAERAVVHASFGPYGQSTTASWDEPACYETADLKRRQLAMNSVARLYEGEFVSWPDAAGKDVEFGMSEPNPAAALLWHRRAAESFFSGAAASGLEHFCARLETQSACWLVPLNLEAPALASPRT